MVYLLPLIHTYFKLSLDELNASYELNAYTFIPENMYFIKSDLVKNIQNTFKQANIEIFSTQYIDIREFKKEEKANSKENKR